MARRTAVWHRLAHLTKHTKRMSPHYRPVRCTESNFCTATWWIFDELQRKNIIIDQTAKRLKQ